MKAIFSEIVNIPLYITGKRLNRDSAVALTYVVEAAGGQALR